MKTKIILTVLIMVFLTISPLGYPLDPQKKVTQYIHDSWGLEDGLPYSGVTAITQTEDGYLWLGTWAGLVRFDGVRFEVYDKSRVELFPYSYIPRVLEDSNGKLWIATSGSGVICMEEGRFTAITTKDGLSNDIVRDIFEDRERNLWIGTAGGLNQLRDGKFDFYTTKDGLSNNSIWSICKDREGILWIGTDGGLNRLKDGKFDFYTTKNGLSSNNIRSIYGDRQGNLWIGTWGGGLDCLKDGRIISYKTKEGLTNGKIFFIYNDQEGNLWIGTEGGLNRLNPKDGKVTSFTTKDGLSHDDVYAIHEDREGSLWIGTLSGLNRLRGGKFTSYTTKEGLFSDLISGAIYEDRKGNLWIGTGGGLNRLNPEDEKLTLYTTQDGLSHNMAYSLYEDQEGSLWIGTKGGLNRLNSKNGKFTSYTTKDGLSHNTVFAVYGDREGNLWIGTESGLNRFNPKDDTFTSYTTRNGLANNKVYAISNDREGNLWVGTLSGLNRLRGGEFTLYTTRDGLSENCVVCIYDDGEGSIWLGTYGGGLNRLKEGEFKSITSKEGLFDDTVLQILEDDFKNLWMSCSKGIFRVNKQELENFFTGRQSRVTPVFYNEKDGMNSRECIGGMQPAGWKSRDGKLWFPTVKGVVMIDPNNIKINRIPPPVKIEVIIVNNKNIEPPFNPDGKKLILSPGKERFEIHYTGLSFLVPERVRFKCKLEGVDEEWQDMGTRRTAYYTTLPPGDYTFRVKACNNDGIWNETDASVSFYLKPFFYQTTWFYLLCALVIISIGLTGYRLRVRQLKSRQKELAALVKVRTREVEDKNRQLEEQSEKLKEMDKVKSRFFANISHEFRTPLTLLMGPLEQMIAACGDDEKERKRKLTLMLRNAQRLLRLINQLLELSKLDSGKMKLYAAKTNIISFLKGIVDSFRFLAQQKELELVFHTEIENESLILYIDPRKMEDIMSNLLLNAVKFTPPGGEIKVTLRENPAAETNFPEGSLETWVSDTGPGIPADQLAHVFDRFFQADSTYEHHQKGSGIGLALSKELVELHHGTIEARSREGEGTAFIIRLPIGSAHLASDEIAEADMPAGVKVGVPMEIESETADNDVNDAAKFETDFDASAQEKDIILVVEDSADMRDYIREALEPDYTIVDAEDGREGIQKAQEIIPDLIISDIMMPEVDGYELCRVLKSEKITSHIPVILLTARASEENILQGLETGADDYITKPFSTKILSARIKNLIDVRSQLRMNINRELTLQPVKTSVSKIDQEFLHDLHKVINENLADEEFNVEQLCKKLYMSRTTLYRKVLAISGLTPTEYIRSYRLKRGAELLKQNYGTVLEVSVEVGFSNSSYFAKCFKEKFHQLPSQYHAGSRQ